MRFPPALTLSVLLSGAMLADPVNENQVTTFVAGQPACAADMNQTIQALIAAVNDNAARVAELEARLRQVTRPLADLVSGSTYKIFSYETALGEFETTIDVQGPGSIVKNTNGRLGHWGLVESGTLTLHDDGTVQLDADSFEREVYVDTFATHDVDSPNVPNIGRVELSTPFDDVESVSIMGTWTFDGQVVTLDIDEETTPLFVSADGNILMTGGGSIETQGSLSLLASSMVMAVRTNPSNILVEDFEGNALPSGGPDVVFEVADGVMKFRTLRILNNGDADLTNVSLSLAWTPTVAGGEGFEITQGLGSTTLAAGGQALITIGFVSNQFNNLDGTLTITSDDPDTPSYVVNLDGPSIQ